jgi:hypothetical protein
MEMGQYESETAGVLVGEAVLKIAMRCYYPLEFLNLIVGKGFEVVDTWGGYDGEAYGSGPESVVAFRDGGRESRSLGPEGKSKPLAVPIPSDSVSLP